MPCSPAKARLLLKEKKAIVKRRTPFTIQLTIATGEAKQPVSLGIDAGYKHVGLSASPATSAPKGSANSSSRSRRVGTTGRFISFPSSKAAFESAIRLPSKSRASVFLTKLPAREKKASFSAVDHRGSLMFENLTEPAFQPASAARSCICWKRDEPI